MKQQCRWLPNISPTTEIVQMGKALLLQEDVSQQEQQDNVLPTAVVMALDGTEAPSSHQDSSERRRSPQHPPAKASWLEQLQKHLFVICRNKEQWQDFDSELPPESILKITHTETSRLEKMLWITKSNL